MISDPEFNHKVSKLRIRYGAGLRENFSLGWDIKPCFELLQNKNKQYWLKKLYTGISRIRKIKKVRFSRKVKKNENRSMNRNDKKRELREKK